MFSWASTSISHLELSHSYSQIQSTCPALPPSLPLSINNLITFIPSTCWALRMGVSTKTKTDYYQLHEYHLHSCSLMLAWERDPNRDLRNLKPSFSTISTDDPHSSLTWALDCCCCWNLWWVPLAWVALGHGYLWG